MAAHFAMRSFEGAMSWPIAHVGCLMRFTSLHKSLSAAATNSEARLNIAESWRPELEPAKRCDVKLREDVHLIAFLCGPEACCQICSCTSWLSAGTRLNVDMHSMVKLLRQLLVLAAVTHHVDAITFKTAARAPVQKAGQGDDYIGSGSGDVMR